MADNESIENNENEESTETKESTERKELDTSYIDDKISSLLTAFNESFENVLKKLDDMSADLEAAAGGDQDKKESKEEDNETEKLENDIDEDTLNADVESWDLD